MVNEYISKRDFNDAIREAVRKYPNTFYNGLEVARKIAHDMDAADVAPVRHGRWDNSKASFGEMCSECKFIVWWDDDGPHKFNYCPNCGAKMEVTDERT